MSEDNRRIHIKGIGHVAQAPDTVVLSLSLTAQHSEYSAALKIGSQQLEMLREAIVEVGFKGDDLKTTNFDVRTIYEDEEFREGISKRYRQNFVGFECRHDLRLTFNLDADKLGATVDTIAACLSEPKISIAFTIKDTDAFTDKLLKSATRDAKHKARILCAAAGVKLGRLLEINYSRDEASIRNELRMENRVLGCNSDTAFEFQPEDVTMSDTVDFLWEIE